MLERMKFRGWSPKEKCWLTTDDIANDIIGRFDGSDDSLSPLQAQAAAFEEFFKLSFSQLTRLGQWTGRKDKNEKDIYEGHRVVIYKETRGGAWGTITYDFRGTIIYDERLSLFGIKTREGFVHPMHVFDDEDCEIVGNIQSENKKGEKDGR